MSTPSGINDRTTAFFTSVVAVLAAVGTLFATHRSINALSDQAHALRYSQQASDQYAYYQSEQTRVATDEALIVALPDSSRTSRLQALAATGRRNSLQVYERAKALEASSERVQDHAQGLLRSFELLEVTTTFFEISIAFASIGVLTHVRAPLVAGAILSGIGLIVGVVGYFVVR